PPRSERAVQRVELRGDGIEALAFRTGARLFRSARAERLVLREPRCLGGGELRLVAHTGRCDDRAPRSRGLERDALQAGERGDEDRRVAEELRARCAVARGAHMEAVA